MMMNTTNGTMYVNITLFNYTSSSPVILNITLMNFKCVYWDVDLNDWSRDGCWVGVEISKQKFAPKKYKTNKMGYSMVQVIGKNNV